MPTPARRAISSSEAAVPCSAKAGAAASISRSRLRRASARRSSEAERSLAPAAGRPDFVFFFNATIGPHHIRNRNRKILGCTAAVPSLFFQAEAPPLRSVTLLQLVTCRGSGAPRFQGGGTHARPPRHADSLRTCLAEGTSVMSDP